MASTSRRTCSFFALLRVTKGRLWILALFAALLASLLATPAVAVPLVRAGQPIATIVIARSALQPAKEDQPANKVAAAAKDFRDYVRKMSGAELPIVADDANPKGPLVLIGRSRLAEKQGVSIPSGVTPERKEEGFVIVATANSLILAGNDAGPYHGTEYAVADMLERLGVRWFMPGEFGEYVPHRSTIEVPPLRAHKTPDFRMRNWWVHASPEMAQQERQWKIRNKMNPDEIIATPTDSSIRAFVAGEELIRTRPELFAKNANGTPNPHLPNLTHPDAIRLTSGKMIALFRSEPGLDSIGIAPVDGMPRDFTPTTVAHNRGFPSLIGREGQPGEASTTEEWLEFVNAVARAVGKEFPDKIITTNGYATRDNPPLGVAVEPNVSIMFAAIWADTLHALDDGESWQGERQRQMLKRWTELSDKVWIYGYNHTMLVSALTPVPVTRKLARDIPLMKELGVIGFLDEARNQWAESGITTKYVRARLEWDADADVGGVLNDFFGHWYGAAAEPSKAFWDELESAVKSTPLLGHEDRILPFLYTPDLMARLALHLEAAEKQAVDERSRSHVRVDRLIYEHLKAYVAMSAADLTGDWAQAACQADLMMSLRKQIMDINPFFLLDHEGQLNSGIWYWGVVERGKYYRKLADLTSGKTGHLVALLPQEARFAIDPRDEGRFAGWYGSGWNSDGWRRLSTTRPFYTQGYASSDGYPYLGAMWYRFEVDVPMDFDGEPITLLATALETEAWLWVNGEYLGHRPYQEAYTRPSEFQVDVSKALKAGEKNVIAMRVQTGSNAAQAAGGLVGRVLLYSPKPSPPVNTPSGRE